MFKASAVVGLLWLGLGTMPAAGERPVLVELFTSEGCSTCPPADALLAELASRPGLLALSFHVDYWDRLGWKDPFSTAAATARQQRYAELLGLATVYTPQLVIDGRWQAVGSDRAQVERAILVAGRERGQPAVTIALDDGRARITVGRNGEQPGTAVLLIGFDRRQVNRVMRGENAGRTLTHVDVVRSIAEAARLTDGSGALDLPMPLSSDRVAVIVQAPDGHILGAAVHDLDTR
jgi:hypothetical protein